LNRKA